MTGGVGGALLIELSPPDDSGFDAFKKSGEMFGLLSSLRILIRTICDEQNGRTKEDATHLYRAANLFVLKLIKVNSICFRLVNFQFCLGYFSTRLGLVCLG